MKHHGSRSYLNKGFTLIELLVVIGIIAILTGLVAFNFNQARMRARDVQRKNDLAQLKSALELYRNDNNQKYPNASDYGGLMTILSADGYVPNTLEDPKVALSGTSSWAQYIYSSVSPFLDYTIGVCLENRSDDLANGADCGSIPNPAAGRYYTFSTGASVN